MFPHGGAGGNSQGRILRGQHWPAKVTGGHQTDRDVLQNVFGWFQISGLPVIRDRRVPGTQERTNMSRFAIQAFGLWPNVRRGTDVTRVLGLCRAAIRHPPPENNRAQKGKRKKKERKAKLEHRGSHETSPGPIRTASCRDSMTQRTMPPADSTQ